MAKNKSGDTHHIFWPRTAYRGTYLSKLRNHWYCKAYIPREYLHQVIHAEIRGVPCPKVFNVKEALIQLDLLGRYNAIDKNDPIEKKLSVLGGLFQCCDEETYQVLRRQLEIVKGFYKSS